MALNSRVEPTIQSWVNHHVQTEQPICRKTGAVLKHPVDADLNTDYLSLLSVPVRTTISST